MMMVVEMRLRWGALNDPSENFIRKGFMSLIWRFNKQKISKGIQNVLFVLILTSHTLTVSSQLFIIRKPLQTIKIANSESREKGKFFVKIEGKWYLREKLSGPRHIYLIILSSQPLFTLSRELDSKWSIVEEAKKNNDDNNWLRWMYVNPSGTLHQSTKCVCISSSDLSNPYRKQIPWMFLRQFLFYLFPYALSGILLLLYFSASLPFNPFADMLSTDIYALQNVKYFLLVTKNFISLFNALPIELMSATFFMLMWFTNVGTNR